MIEQHAKFIQISFGDLGLSLREKQSRKKIIEKLEKAGKHKVKAGFLLEKAGESWKTQAIRSETKQIAGKHKDFVSKQWKQLENIRILNGKPKDRCKF